MMNLFDEAKSAYVARQRKREEAERVTRNARRKFDLEWLRYAFDHPPFPMDGARIDTELVHIELENRELGISVNLPWGSGPMMPDEVIAKGMFVDIDWHIRGVCPDCLEEIWSRGFSDMAGLGEQLIEFEPSYAHREWECKANES